MEYSIEVQNLSKHFKDFSLQKVSFNVPTGAIVGFIGENGAGKTTSIKSILGLLHTDGGSIRVLGKDPVKDRRVIGEDIGIVMEGSFFSPILNMREIGAVMAKLHPRWDAALYEDFCKRFSLPAQKPVKDFSRGMRVKAAFAVALAHHPRLLILDEATSGLDPVVRSEILDLFLEFIEDENHSILLSSHITSDLEKVADYIVFIHNGQIVFQMEKDTLLERFAVCKCGKGELSRFEQAHILGHRESRFDLEFLVDNAPLVRKAYPALLTEPASIDDIMTFFVKGSDETV